MFYFLQFWTFEACGSSFINETYVHVSTREKKSVMDFGRAKGQRFCAAHCFIVICTD